MTAPNALTVKHVDEDESIVYLAATSLQIAMPHGEPSFLLVEVPGEHLRRTAHGGHVTVYNAQGVPLDTVRLGTIRSVTEAGIAAPQMTETTPTEGD